LRDGDSATRNCWPMDPQQTPPTDFGRELSRTDVLPLWRGLAL
jgi:hypothetical protein